MGTTKLQGLKGTYLLTLFFILFLSNPVNAFTDENTEDKIYISMYIGDYKLNLSENLSYFNYRDCISRYGEQRCDTVRAIILWNWTGTEWDYEYCLSEVFGICIGTTLDNKPIARLNIKYPDGTIFSSVVLNEENEIEYYYKGQYQYEAQNSSLRLIDPGDEDGPQIVNLSISGLNYADLGNKLISVSVGGVSDTFEVVEVRNQTLAYTYIEISDLEMEIYDNNDFEIFDNVSLTLNYTYNYSTYDDLKKDEVIININGGEDYNDVHYGQDTFTRTLNNLTPGDQVEVTINLFGKDGNVDRSRTFHKIYTYTNVTEYFDPETGQYYNISAPVSFDLTEDAKWSNLSCQDYFYEEGVNAGGGGCTARQATQHTFLVSDEDYEDFVRFGAAAVDCYFANASNDAICDQIVCKGGLCLKGAGNCDGGGSSYGYIALPTTQAGTTTYYGQGYDRSQSLPGPIEAICKYTCVDDFQNAPVGLNLGGGIILTESGWDIQVLRTARTFYKHEFISSGEFNFFNFEYDQNNNGIINITMESEGFDNATVFQDVLYAYDLYGNFTEGAGVDNNFYLNYYYQDPDTDSEKLSNTPCATRAFYYANYTSAYSPQFYTLTVNVINVVNNSRLFFPSYDQVIVSSELSGGVLTPGFNGFTIDYETESSDVLTIEVKNNGSTVFKSEPFEVLINQDSEVFIYVYPVDEESAYNQVHFLIQDANLNPVSRVQISASSPEIEYNIEGLSNTFYTNPNGHAVYLTDIEGVINFTISKPAYRTHVIEHTISPGSELINVTLELSTGGTADGGTGYNYGYWERLFQDYSITRQVIGLALIVLVMVSVGNATKHTPSSGMISVTAGIISAVAMTGTLLPETTTLFICLIIAAGLAIAYRDKILNSTPSAED